MPEFGTLTHDLIRMRESKVSKYDLLCKDLISLRHSSLARLLKVRGYRVDRIEFTELHGERADALYRRGDRIVHVEFQTKNDADLPWRMLEYYVRIIGTHGKRSNPEELRVDQVILYIGAPAATPQESLRTQNLDFTFGWTDIRDYAKEADGLLASRLPDDWILGVLCKPDTDDVAWEGVASLIARLDVGYDSHNLIKTKFLLAAHARRLGETRIRRLMNMVAIFNVGDSEALRSLADGILSDGGVRELLKVVGRMLSDRRLTLSSDDIALLASFELHELHEFIGCFSLTSDLDESFEAARRAEPHP